jgi:hypothetical protein
MFWVVRNRKIRRSRISSSGSGTAIVLRPERSRIVVAWWWILHALLSFAAAVVAWPLPVRIVLLALVAAHGILRYPARIPEELVRRRDGSWVLPRPGVTGLRLGPGSCCTHAWIRLVLVGPVRRRVVVLLRDQFTSPVWRALQAVLRRAE